MSLLRKKFSMSNISSYDEPTSQQKQPKQKLPKVYRPPIPPTSNLNFPTSASTSNIFATAAEDSFQPSPYKSQHQSNTSSPYSTIPRTYTNPNISSSSPSTPPSLPPRTSSTQIVNPATGVALTLPPGTESEDQLSPELLTWVYDTKENELTNKGFSTRLVVKNNVVTMILDNADLAGMLDDLGIDESNARHTIAPPENTHAKVFIQVLDVWNKNVPQNCEIYYTLHLDNQVQKSKPSMNEKRLSNAGAKFNEMLLLNASNNFKMELKLYLKFPESTKPQTKSKPNKSFFSSLKRTGFLSSSKNASGAAALGDHFNGLTTYLGSVHFDLHAVNFGKCTKTFPVVIDKMNARVMSGYLDGKKAGEVAAEVTMKIGVFREWPMNGRTKASNYENYLTVQVKTTRIPTWRRYWVAIDTKECALQLYDFEYKHDKHINSISLANVTSTRMADREIYDLANCFELVETTLDEYGQPDTILVFADSKEEMHEWIEKIMSVVKLNNVKERMKRC